MRLFYSLVLLSALMISSCAVYTGGESATPFDSEPPAGYSPVFVKTIEPYSPAQDAKLIISSVNVNQPNLIKLRVHLLDTSQTKLFSGAGSADFKKIWCIVIDSSGDANRPISKYKVYEVTENDPQPYSIAVVMDHSGSMGEDRAKTVQAAAYQVIEKKRVDDMLALVKYDGKCVIECSLTSSKSELQTKLRQNGLENFGGLTAISDGILAGINELAFAPKDHIKSIIVFTDGQDNSSHFPKDSIITLAKSRGISINSIDFGDNINDAYMKDYSTATGGIYHHIYSTKEFDYVFEDIYKRMLNSYVIEYRPQEYGNHKVKIKLCPPAGEVSAEKLFNNTPDLGAIGLLSITFDFDKAVIQKESEEAIDGIYTLLKAYPNMLIELRGHTDSINKGSDLDYNTKLSQKRADAVRQSLIKKGIEPGRVMSRGYGDSMPIASNNSEEGRKRNRRTEFIILKK